MAWHASLKLDYSLRAERTVAHFLHDGPLRVLQSLYPEGDAVCHNVLVHPPGGLVGGDTLDITVRAQSGTHGLITTPGATRFYRSEGLPALQSTRLDLQAGARLEWVPLEAICYSGCHAENRLTMAVAPGAELIGWDITALGLPAANQPFGQGRLCQRLEVPGLWLEHGIIDAQDTRLLNNPLGLAGLRCMATIFFIAGTPLGRQPKEQALEATRVAIAAHPLLAATAGATSPNPQMLVARVLAPVVEPAVALLREIRGIWRSHFWTRGASHPRIWST